MKAITFINRFLISGIILIFTIGILVEKQVLLLLLLITMPVFIFQVLSSFFFISRRENMIKGLKIFLSIYIGGVAIYFLLFYLITNNLRHPSDFIAIGILALLMIFFTVITEVLYNLSK